MTAPPNSAGPYRFEGLKQGENTDYARLPQWARQPFPFSFERAAKGFVFVGSEAA